MKAIGLKDNKFGGIEQLEFQQVEKPKLRKDEVLVRVKATALNRADILQRQGKYPPPPGDSEIIGLEVAGIIEDEGTQNVWKRGDRVMGLVGGGGYAEFCSIPASSVMRIPEKFTFEQAAAIPEAFLTSFQALFWLSELQKRATKGIHVLIHAGASGVGTSCIQLCKLFPEVKVIVTVGSKEKQDFCKSLGADFTINYKEENFNSKVLEYTDNKGVDILIDFIGAPYWNDNLKSLKLDSVMVSLAMMGGAKVEGSNLSHILTKRIHIKGSTLRTRDLDYKAQLVSDFSNVCLKEFEKGSLKPIISHTFNWKDVQQAHHIMETNQNSGKIILTMD